MAGDFGGVELCCLESAAAALAEIAADGVAAALDEDEATTGALPLGGTGFACSPAGWLLRARAVVAGDFKAEAGGCCLICLVVSAGEITVVFSVEALLLAALD